MFFNYKQYMNVEFPFKIQILEGMRVPRQIHAHDYLQICYVMKGECIHKVYDTEVNIIKGNIFSVVPFVEHEILVAENKPIKLAIIDFMPNFINENMRDFNTMEDLIDFAFIEPIISFKKKLLPKLDLSSKAQILIEQNIENMLKEIELKEVDYQLCIKVDLMKILVIIGREFKQYINNNQKEHPIKKYKKLFYDSVLYLEDHFDTEIRLEEIAHKAAMAPTYYSHIFKVMKGTSFIEYLNKLRVTKSTELLEETDLSITEIALNVGYNSLGHFIKMFKQITGVTPSIYRKKTGIS